MDPADRTGFRASRYPAANVASVPQCSPLRYPGGKTWLIPHVEAWLRQLDPKPALLVEPFCGGGSVSLSAVMEGWAERASWASWTATWRPFGSPPCGMTPR